MDFQVCLCLQSMKTICCRYVRQPMCLLMFFCYSKIHFHQLGPFKLIKTMLKSLNVVKGLSPVLNHYPKGSHNTWAT